MCSMYAPKIETKKNLNQGEMYMFMDWRSQSRVNINTLPIRPEMSAITTHHRKICI